MPRAAQTHRAALFILLYRLTTPLQPTLQPIFFHKLNDYQTYNQKINTQNSCTFENNVLYLSYERSNLHSCICGNHYAVHHTIWLHKAR